MANNMFQAPLLDVSKMPGSHIPGGAGVVNNMPVLQTPYTIDMGGLTGNPTKGSNTGMVPLNGTQFTANGTMPFNLSGLTGGSITGTDRALPKKLNELYGGGMGATVLQMLQTGGFSPAVAQAMLNAMMPMEARGRESVLNSFGNLGLRDSSAAMIGLGDFESQFTAQQMATLAGLQNEAIGRSFGLLEHIMPQAAAEKANESSIWDTLSGVLGIASPFLNMIPGIGPILSGITGGLSRTGGGGGGVNAMDAMMNAGGPTVEYNTGGSMTTAPTSSVPLPQNIDFSSIDPFEGLLTGTSIGIA